MFDFSAMHCPLSIVGYSPKGPKSTVRYVPENPSISGLGWLFPAPLTLIVSYAQTLALKYSLNVEKSMLKFLGFLIINWTSPSKVSEESPTPTICIWIDFLGQFLAISAQISAFNQKGKMILNGIDT